jgi:hypothetical protein
MNNKPNPTTLQGTLKKRPPLNPSLRFTPTAWAKPPRGYWRSRMRRRFPKRQYGQRWQSETVISMVKRLLDAALRARTYWSQSREIILRVLTLNLMILRRAEASTEQF